VSEIVNFHDVDSVLSKHLSLGEQALNSYRTSRGMADDTVGGTLAESSTLLVPHSGKRI